MRRLIFAAALAAATPAAAQAETLRLASVGPIAGPCKPLAANALAGERAYHDLLAKRLGLKVLACPMSDAASAGRALAAGEVDVAILDPGAYGQAASSARAILTLRAKGALSRVPVVVAVKGDAPQKTLAALKGAAVVFGGAAPAALDLPRKALADQGAGPGFFSREDVAVDNEAAAAALRTGRAAVMALNADDWQRLCRGNSPNEDRCTDLRVVWRGRPRAQAALAVRRDMPDQLRFRLIGVHVAMHLEAPAAFAAASAFAPGAAEFEPAEAEALRLTAAGR